jgi:hypothetical protein
VTAGSSVGVRWYEFRLSGGNPTVFQQGTYAPDSTFRWMGSIAMDHAGNIALGYSQSSSTTHPSIRFTGRAPADPLGTMTQAETTVFTGGGSQTSGLNRWGDYTAMQVDPSDDCTFWYINEYIPANGSFNWNTRLASFQLPGCSTTQDFSISDSPSSGTVTAGNSTTSTITVTDTGTPQTVSLSASGLPAGATASFNPSSLTGTGTSTMTISTSASTPTGTSTITITGTGTSGTHTTTYSLTVNPVNDFSISVSPTSGSVVQGNSTTTTVSTAVTSGSAQTVSLSASGLPSGATATFNPTSVTAGNSSTLTISTASTTPTGTSTITITGTGTSATHSTTYSLTVTGTVNTVTVNNPGNQSTPRRTSVSLQMTATDSQAGQTFTWSATGLPSGLSINSSTGLISGTTGRRIRTFTVTVTATDTTGAQGSTSFTWTIT